MKDEERAVFELKLKYSRGFWLGITSFHIVMVVLMWIIRPHAFDLTFSSLVLDENRVFVVLIALVTLWVSFGLRKKNEYAGYVLDVRGNENLLAAGYLYSPMLAFSITCWEMVLALYLDYSYSFVWFAVGLLGSLYVLPTRAKYKEIFRRVNEEPIQTTTTAPL